MKTIFRSLASVLILLITFVVLANVSNTISLETSFFSLRVNVGFLIFFSAVSASIAVLLFSFSFSSSNTKIKQTLENTKLNYEIELEKIKQLEAKVKTLEEALKVATKG